MASALDRLTLVMTAFRRRKHVSKSLRRGMNACVVLTKVAEDRIEVALYAKPRSDAGQSAQSRDGLQCNGSPTNHQQTTLNPEVKKTRFLQSF